MVALLLNYPQGQTDLPTMCEFKLNGKGSHWTLACVLHHAPGEDDVMSF